jgi:hypothetical protein
MRPGELVPSRIGARGLPGVRRGQLLHRRCRGGGRVQVCRLLVPLWRFKRHGYRLRGGALRARRVVYGRRLCGPLLVHARLSFYLGNFGRVQRGHRDVPHLRGGEFMRGWREPARCVQLRRRLLFSSRGGDKLCWYIWLLCDLWRRKFVRGQRGGANALLVQRWICFNGDNVEWVRDNHGDVRHLRRGGQVSRSFRAALAVCMQCRILLARGRDDGVYRDHPILHALWCRKLMRRHRRCASGMHVHAGIFFNLGDIERVHNKHGELWDVRGRILVCWRCRAARGMHVHAGIFLSRGSGHELCGYGGVLHDLHWRKLLRRYIISARGLQLHTGVLLGCGSGHELCGYGRLLRVLWRRKLVRGQRCGTRVVYMQRWVCVNGDNVQRVQHNDGDVYSLRGGGQVFRGRRAARAVFMQRWVLLIIAHVHRMRGQQRDMHCLRRRS